MGVITLVIITSAGIFGFLSNAYQGATASFEKESTALLYKQDRLDQLIEDKKFLKEELDAAVSELPDNYRTAKRKLREDYQPKINDIKTTCSIFLLLEAAEKIFPGTISTNGCKGPLFS